MLDKKTIKDKMEERGFVVYATLGDTQLQFVSEHMYDTSYEQKTPKKQQIPVINIIVNLKTEEFKCIYNLNGSVNTLSTPLGGSVMNDEFFDKIVSRFESEAKWMSRLTE